MQNTGRAKLWGVASREVVLLKGSPERTKLFSLPLPYFHGLLLW